MIAVFLSIGLFAAAVTVHIIFCRQSPRHVLQAKAFGIIAFIFLAAYGAVAFVSSMPFAITAGLLFILLIPIYLCFYVLTQLVSPSKYILEIVVKSKGLSREDIIRAVHKKDFIDSRLHDLVASGCVRLEQERYILTDEGKKIAGVLTLMQSLLGREVGG